MIVIVDYGMGNLRSVAKAAEFLGKKVKVTDDPDIVQKAKKIIFPGVGHFDRTVKELKKKGLFTVLKEKIKSGIPFLGICLGMQLLFEESEEAPGVTGFNIFAGRVKKFKTRDLTVPHMGWNTVNFKDRNDIFKGIKPGTYFYFVHSYYCQPQSDDIILSTTDYGDRFVSSIRKDNIRAVQFHPEKSQEYGLKLFNNFLEL